MSIDLNSCYDFYLNNRVKELISITAPYALFAVYLWYNLTMEQWNMMNGRERKTSLRKIFKKIGLEDIFEDDDN